MGSSHIQAPSMFTRDFMGNVYVVGYALFAYRLIGPEGHGVSSVNVYM